MLSFSFIVKRWLFLFQKGNHNDIIKVAGLNVKPYPYYNPKTRGLNFSGLFTAISLAKPGI